MVEHVRDAAGPELVEYRGHDVFVSYSRADRDFVTRLNEAMAARGRSLWVDWEGIPPTAEWMAEIREAIDGADTFVVVMSPESVRSQVCSDELTHAVEANKRIVPIVAREVEPASVPPELAKLNWLFARESDDFERAVEQLVEALDTDLDQVKFHTRLLVRAREWEQAGKGASKLLRGGDLTDAERWLGSPGRGVTPTTQQTAYVVASRRAATGRQRRLVAGVSVALVIALVAGTLALVQTGRAQRSATAADAERLGAQALVAKDVDIAMLLAREGLALDDSPATRSNLLSVVAKWNPVIGSIDPGIGGLTDTSGMDLSADGRFLVAVVGGRQKPDAVVIDTRTDAIVRHLDEDFYLPFYRFGRANTLLVVPRWSSRVEGQDPLTGTVEWSTRFPRSTTGCCNMVLTPDGKTLAIESNAKITLFDTATGSARTLRPPKGQDFADVKFTPDGRQLVEFYSAQKQVWAATKHTVTVAWRDLATSKLERVTRTRVDYTNIQNADESSDGRWLWVGAFNDTVRLYDTLKHRRFILHTPDFPILERLSPDGKILVVASHDFTITVWRVRDGTLLETLTGQAGWPNAGLSFSPDGRTLYAGGQDGKILLWDIQGGRRLGRPLSGMIEGMCDLHNSFAVSPNGKLVAVSHGCGQDGESSAYVSLRDLSTQKLILKRPSFASSVAFSPDGRTFVTADKGGVVRLRDVTSGSPVGPPMRGPPKYVRHWGYPLARKLNEMRAFAFSPDGSTLAAGADDGRIYLWDVRSGSPMGEPLPMPSSSLGPDQDPEFRIAGRSIEDLVFSPDGSELAASVGTSVVIWRLSDRSRVTTLPLNDPFGVVFALSYSPDGRLLATGQGEGTLRLWDTRTWKQVGNGARASSGVASIAFDPGGDTMVTAGYGSSVRLFDTASLTEIGQPFPGISGPPAFAVFTPDGRHIIMGNFSYRAFEWDVDPTDWASHACEVAGRNLTPEEWSQFLPDRPYRTVCPAYRAGP